MIARLQEIVWHFPWALAVAFTPLLLRSALWLRRRRLLDYADPHLRAWAVRDSPVGAGLAWSEWLLWLCIALALAGPRLPRSADEAAAQQVRRHDVDVMVVLNVAASMERAYDGMSSLARAKLELADLLARLQGERIGLIAVNGSAGLVLPPTSDYALYARFLDYADSSLLEPGVVQIGTALDLARLLLKQRSSRSQAVLLVSDAAPESTADELGALALQSAQALQQNGISLAVLDVSPAAQANPAALAELAKLARGWSAVVADGDRDWRRLYDEGIALLASALKPPRHGRGWVELFPIAVVLAALVMILPYWRGRNVIMLALALLPFSARAEAGLTQAYSAFRSSDFARAQILYAGERGYDARFGEGASAYRRKDYAYAGRQFALALLEANSLKQRADALFNLGNARFMQEQYSAALEAYRDAKRYRPSDAAIAHNHELAARRFSTQRRARDEDAPGRRGAQVGGRLGEDISDRPAGMEDDEKSQPWMSLDDSSAAQRASRGTLGGDPASSRGGRNASVSLEEAQRAAKKVEMLRDEPKALLGTLLKFEEQRRRNASAEK